MGRSPGMDKEHPSLTCGFLDLRHAFHHALGREHLHKVLLHIDGEERSPL